MRSEIEDIVNGIDGSKEVDYIVLLEGPRSPAVRPLSGRR